MKRRLLILQLLLSLCTFMVMAANEGNKTSPFGGKRVLFIGIDGLRPDALQKAIAGGMTPNLKQLVDGGTVSWSAYAGGPKGTPAEQPTISGAGWTSFYTGTWTDRHGVINNSSPAYDHPLAVSSYQSKRSPTFAVRLKEKVAGASVASIVSWDWIEDYLIPAAPDAFSFHEKGIGANYGERDASVVDKTRAYLAANDPDVLMLHLDQVDGAGHASGFSADNPDYLKALVKVDSGGCIKIA